jgi:hypothetical protein
VKEHAARDICSLPTMTLSHKQILEKLSVTAQHLTDRTLEVNFSYQFSLLLVGSSSIAFKLPEIA